MNRSFSPRWLLALVPFALAACSSTPVQAPAAPAASAPAPTQPAAPKSSTAPVAPQAAALPAHLDPNNRIYRERSIYFDFDEAVLRRQDLPVIEAHGQYLSHNPSLQVRVEGNTDERGSSEYNLALGQRRAQAVKQALLIQGAKDTQVEAVSFGKEKPKATGHDEAAWAQNRRADIVYPAK